MLVHRRITPGSVSLVPIYTPGRRETIWGKDSCLRKQHDGRGWASNHRPSDLKSNALTTTPPRLLHCKFRSSVLAPKMGPPWWVKYSAILRANLALYFKAIIALFTGAGPAPKGQIGSHCGLFRLSMGLVLSTVG